MGGVGSCGEARAPAACVASGAHLVFAAPAPRGPGVLVLGRVGGGGRTRRRAAVALRRQGPVCMTLVDDVITTPRLMLVSLTPSLLRAVAGGDLVEVERQLGAPVGA